MPDWRTPLASRLKPLALRPGREREILDELSQHLDDRYHELRTGGASDDDAVRLALDELDDERLLASEMRRLRQASVPEPIPPGLPARTWLGDARHDLVYGARMLRKSPGFSAVAIVTLALGIGANSAIFSLVNATLLQRLPVHNHDRLLYVFRDNGPWHIVSYPAYGALRDGAKQIEGLAAWGFITASLERRRRHRPRERRHRHGQLFRSLRRLAGTRTLPVHERRRDLHGASGRRDQPSLWRGRFAGRPDILGHQIRLNGTLFTIVGVTPATFPGPAIGTTSDIYVPMMMQPLIRPPRAGYSGDMDPDLLKNPNNGWLFVVALRKRDATAQQAQAELSALATAYLRSRERNARDHRLSLVPIDRGNPTQRARLQSVATLLGCVVGVVLLIACANVANLLLSKASARRREVAIRLALGASRWRIVRQLLAESLLLSTLGGAVGLFVAWLVMKGFEVAPPPLGALPLALEFSTDRRVLMFSLALSAVTGLTFGIVPALQASRPVPALKDQTFPPDGGPRRLNLKKLLVVAEVALALVLLIAAGLFIRSLRTGRREPGTPGGTGSRLSASYATASMAR